MVCTKAKHITSEDLLSVQLASSSGLTDLNSAQRSSVSLRWRSDSTAAGDDSQIDGAPAADCLRKLKIDMKT